MSPPATSGVDSKRERRHGGSFLALRDPILFVGRNAKASVESL